MYVYIPTSSTLLSVRLSLLCALPAPNRYLICMQVCKRVRPPFRSSHFTRTDPFTTTTTTTTSIYSVGHCRRLDWTMLCPFEPSVPSVPSVRIMPTSKHAFDCEFVQQCACGVFVYDTAQLPLAPNIVHLTKTVHTSHRHKLIPPRRRLASERSACCDVFGAPSHSMCELAWRSQQARYAMERKRARDFSTIRET